MVRSSLPTTCSALLHHYLLPGILLVSRIVTFPDSPPSWTAGRYVVVPRRIGLNQHAAAHDGETFPHVGMDLAQHHDSLVYQFKMADQTVVLHLRLDDEWGQSVCSYVGQVMGKPHARVSVVACGGLKGFWSDGFLEYIIHPQSHSGRPGTHIVESRNVSAVPNLLLSEDGVPSAKKQGGKRQRFQRSVASPLNGITGLLGNFLQPKFIEMVLVVDQSMRSAWAYQDKDLQNYLFSMVSTVEKAIAHPSIGHPMTLVLNRVVMLSGREMEDYGLIYANGDQALANFCRHQNRLMKETSEESDKFDVSILITREDLCVEKSGCSSVGVTNQGAMCNPNLNCAIVEDVGGYHTGLIIAHEIGHLLNMKHDSVHSPESRCLEGSRQIMNNFVSDVFRLEWTHCNRLDLTDFLAGSKGTCLENEPPWSNRRRKKRHYGENYPPEAQCAMIFGGEYTACPKMTCASLKCSPKNANRSQCRSIGMPADGTNCGGYTWCIKGQCVNQADTSIIHGGWSDWGPPGPCSSPCGGGIHYSERKCTRPRPRNGGSYCRGPQKWFMSCNQQNCKTSGPSLRALQCQQYNNKPHLPVSNLGPFIWEPHIQVAAEDQCRLFCRAVGTQMILALQNSVIDGTRCLEDQSGICVDGKCLPLNCDNNPFSDVKLDECGVCGGNGYTCQAVSGRIELSMKRTGYAFALSIPSGSFNVTIQQRSAMFFQDHVYLAIKSADSSEYFLNGDLMVKVGQHTIRGGPLQLIEYSGGDSHQEWAHIPGRIPISMEVQVLVAGDPGLVIVDYIYYQHTNITSYHWVSAWSNCSLTCQGERQLMWVCMSRPDRVPVNPSRCSRKPPQRRTMMCNTRCRLRWSFRNLSTCSCLPDTPASSQPSCVKYVLAGDGPLMKGPEETLPSSHCAHLEVVRADSPCPACPRLFRLDYSPWSECSRTCGGGMQLRQAHCRSNLVGDIEAQTVVEENFAMCTDQTLGPLVRSCGRLPCPQWIKGNWSLCSVSCGSGVQGRQVFCSDTVENGTLGPGTCDISVKPIHIRNCMDTECPPEWATSPWSECSKSCGVGMISRSVWCRTAGNITVEVGLCLPSLRPVAEIHCQLGPCVETVESVKPSSSGLHEGRWVAGEWSLCPTPCGLTGLQSRSVVCMQGNRVVSTEVCHLLPRPQRYQSCRSSCSQNTTSSWIVGRWSQCSVTCGRGHRQRSVVCSTQVPGSTVNSCGLHRPVSVLRCRRESCSYDSCRALKMSGISTDGYYQITVPPLGSLVVFCSGMNETYPKNYLPLRSTRDSDNYSMVFSKSLTNPDTCPDGGPEQGTNTRVLETVEYPSHGTSRFTHVRIDLQSFALKVNDFFANTTGPRPPMFGAAGDCFSRTKKCPQGQFNISLTSTLFAIHPSATWFARGSDTIVDITRAEDGSWVSGRCGGFCGMCYPKDFTVPLRKRGSA